MTRYLISFDDGAMTFPEEDLPAVAEAAHAGGSGGRGRRRLGLRRRTANATRASIVATDGTVTDGPYPETKAVHRRLLRSST